MPLTHTTAFAHACRANDQDEEYGLRMCIGGRSDTWLIAPPGIAGVATTGNRVWGDLRVTDAFVFAAVVLVEK